LQPGIAIDLRFKTNKSEGKVNPDDCTPNVFYDPWSNEASPKVTAKTKIPEDGKLQLKTSRTAPDYVCDHLVELQMVKEVMEAPGGACDEALKFATAEGNTPAMALQKLSQIRRHTWQHRNLFMVESGAEGRKGNTVKTPAKSIPGLVWHKINELHSLVVEGPGAGAPLTAAAIDAEIIAQFPDASTPGKSVVTVWATYAGLVTAEWAVKKAKAEKQLCSALQKEARAGGGGGGGSTSKPTRRAPTLPARMLRRHLSGLARFATAPSSSAFPPVGLSSLVERARKGAARSGPHAPPGRCCPAEKQPQKKVIPRKNVKTAQPPATKPRQPAQRPAPRPANVKKQVAKRPASRARREVGKPRVQTRATPKRKPKITPKPTRRPRGKPRQRRRRR
jgi:hypothetical protein